MINRLWKSFLAVQIGCVNASSFSFINLSKKKKSLNFILTWWWSDNEKCCIFQQKNLPVDKLECTRYNFSIKKKARIDISQGWMKEWTFALKISNQVSTQDQSRQWDQTMRWKGNSDQAAFLETSFHWAVKRELLFSG